MSSSPLPLARMKVKPQLICKVVSILFEMIEVKGFKEDIIQPAREK